MLSDRLRRRLEALNRRPTSDDEETPHFRVIRDEAEAPALGEEREQTARCSVVSLQDEPDSLPGHERITSWGSHWVIQRRIDQLWPTFSRYWPPRTLAAGDGRHADMCALQEVFPQRAVFLDLETCGFAGTSIFLVGLLHGSNEGLMLTQLWARSYAEEKAMLQSLWCLISSQQVLVTFNGKSFDWPQVHDRSTLHHLGRRVERENHVVSLKNSARLEPTDDRPEPMHVDLLHHCRRRWRRQLPNCRLQTLERFICGRRRVGDLPGSDIPDAYHDYVRTGRLDQVQAILHHNALDLVTLLQLAIVFMTGQDSNASP